MAWTTSAVAAALRLVLVGAVMLFGYPMLLLPRRPQWDADDRIAAAGMVGVFFIIAMVYVLAPIHVFEALGLFLVGAGTLAVVIWRRDGARRLITIIRKPQDVLMRTLDRFTDPPALDEVAAAIQAQAKAEEERTRAVRPKRRLVINWPVLGLAVVPAAVGCWVRLTDSVMHPAPAPSDFVVHFQWMKWLTMPEHGLFPEAVYPKGMPAVIAVLRFLSQEAPYLAMKMGPALFNLMWLAGVWYVVKRATGSRVGGMVAVAVYLAMPAWLPGENVRLAYPLPEQFAMGFLLPAGWFAYRYLKSGDRADGMLAAFAAAIVAGTHWGVLVYLAGVFVAVTAAALPLRFAFRRLLTLVGWVVGGTVAGLLPQGIALLLGVPIWETTEGFGIGDPSSLIHPLSVTVLVIAALVLILAIMAMRQRPALLVLPAILITFILMDYLPALGLPMPVLAARGKNFIGLALVAGIGVAYAVIEEIIGLRKRDWVACLAGLAVMGGVFVTFPPRPAHMDPLLTDEMTTQALKLVDYEVPASFRVIGRPELLSLVLGAGFQTDADVWMNAFPVPPSNVTIAKLVADSARPLPGRPEDTPNLFFFVEKEAYLDQTTRVLHGSERITSNQGLAQWVAQYSETHPKAVETWYQSPTLTIYLIRPPKRG